MAVSGMAPQCEFHSRVFRAVPRQDRLAFERAQEVVRTARQVLHQCPEPDTFLGRKTQEPFPQEEGRA